MLERLVDGFLNYHFQLINIFGITISLTIISASLILLIIYLLLHKFNKTLNNYGHVVISTFCLYILFVIAATGLLSINHNYFDYTTLDNYSTHFQTIPLNFLKTYLRIGLNNHTLAYFQSYIYNIFLLLPLGFYLPIIYKDISYIQVLIYSLITSTLIETIQLFLLVYGYNNRTFNIDDIILNTLGAFIGYLIFKPLLSFLQINIYRKRVKYKPYLYFIICFIIISIFIFLIFKKVGGV